MPYTPPSHRSPSSSAPASPEASRRPSFQGTTGAPRPALPRSASYLTKHRRTPSAVGSSNGSINQPSPEATSEDLKGMMNPSVRASPPPITDRQSMPKGAIISPPESSTSSDDDDLPEVRGRTIENLKELHDAISQIPVHRESSPTKTGAPARPDAGDLLILPSQASAIAQGMHHSFSTSSLDDLAHPGRKISHTRSVTDPNVLVTKSAENSLTGSEEDSDEEILRKPQMVRKKSGELVRPALRPPSRRRPSSMPGTPTFSKAVHFDSHLEHVRHFLQVDRPLAVSAGSSPAENYDSDNEYPFPGEERGGVRSPPFEWEIIINNFPLETPARKAQAVRLERVWLSNDQKCLIGSVAVANLAFQKSVTCRFTLDYWKTTSEVAAEYMAEIRSNEGGVSHDRFNFTIKLSDLANLESKTLFFAIRYNVKGQEFWDNNNGTNFQVDFRKKMLPQNGKKGVIGAANRPANALPRSNRRPGQAAGGRPKSMPVAFDEFGDNPKIDFDQSLHEYLGEGPTSLRLKGVKSTTSIPSDNLSTRLSAPSGLAFANRYDFGASLTAAKQSAKDGTPKPDGLYMKPNQRKATPPPPPTTINTKPQPPKEPITTTQPAPAPAPTKALPALPGASGTGSPASPSISSSSYEELVNKYCFFGSKQSSPQIKDGTLRGGRFDGSDDVFMTRSTNSTNSSSHSSPRVSGPQHIHGAQHHTLHPKDPNPYFQHATQFMSFGASPATSPLGNPMNRTSSPSASQPRSSAASVSGQSSGRSPSPASMVGSFQPFTGTSPNDFAYDRYPFSGAEAHAATAIRG